MSNLDDKIEQKRKELQKLLDLKENQSVIMELSEYSDSEKIELFDDIYKMVRGIVTEMEGDDYHEDNDYDNYVYEKAMEILARNKNTKAFWNYINGLI